MPGQDLRIRFGRGCCNMFAAAPCVFAETEEQRQKSEMFLTFRCRKGYNSNRF